MKTATTRSAEAFVPEASSLARLAAASRTCQGCELYRRATQTVFGSGPEDARLMLVGEQPGDMEDRAGKPFVGPAGRMLDGILIDAGIDRSIVYVTNAVKHFKWRPRGKKRMHARPVGSEISACRPWLSAEMTVVQAPVIVCLGAVAAEAVLGPAFRLVASLGKTMELDGRRIIATYHPSAVLRAPTPEARDNVRARIIADLSRAAKLLG